MTTKPCASCGTSVTAPDLAGSAVETADGRRYCASCAARWRNAADPSPRKASPNPVILAPDRPKPEIVLPNVFEAEESPDEPLDPADFPLAADEDEEDAAAPPPPQQPETVRTASGAPVPPAPDPSPAVRTSRRRARGGSKRRKTRRKKPSERDRPAAKRRPAGRPAAKSSSVRVKPGRRRSTGRELPEDAGNSRRTSRRSAAGSLPWYFKLNRGQWIGIVAGGSAFLLFVMVFAVWASSGPRQRTTRNRRPVPYGSGGNELLNQGIRLEKEGRKQEAMKAYRLAVDACNRKAEAARKNGDEATANSADYVARQANMRLYAIMKHSTLRGH